MGTDYIKDPSCQHKYVLKRTDEFYRESGRYANTYTSIDYFFCERCLDEKENKKTITLSINDTLPDWAKLITKKVL